MLLIHVNRNQSEIENKIVATAMRLTVKSDTTKKTDLRCSLTGGLKIYYATEGRMYVSHVRLYDHRNK